MTSTIRRYPGNIDITVNSDISAELGTQEYQRDAFGRFRVSNPFTMFDFNHIMGDLDLLFENKTENGGTITDSSGSYLDLNVTTTTGSSVIRQTREYLAYQPGKSKLTYLTGILVTDLNNTGVISRIGSFDANNGVFFEFNEGTINLVERSHGSDTRVPRSSWTDPLDGTGASGLSVDFDKAQIFTTDYEWLGVGQVRCGIVIDGIFRPCYIFRRSGVNQVVEPYIKYAKLPIRYEIISTGSANTCRIICGSVQSEGGYYPTGKTFTERFSISGVTNSNYHPVISLSLREGTPKFDYNRGTIKVKGNEFLVIDNKYTEYILLRNTDISNVSGATWSNVDILNSIARYRTYTSNDTIDENVGYVINRGFLQTRSATSLISSTTDLFAAIPICSDIDGTPDVVTLAARNISTGTSTLYGTISWIELE